MTYVEPTRGTAFAAPMGGRVVNGAWSAALNEFETFPAKLTEFSRVADPGGVYHSAWSWVELTYGPYGEFVEMGGGRSGEFDANPAFEVNSDEAAADDVVWLRPGWFDVSHGQEWLFSSRCGGVPESGSTSGSAGSESACCPGVDLPATLVLSFEAATGALASLDGDTFVLTRSYLTPGVDGQWEYVGPGTTIYFTCYVPEGSEERYVYLGVIRSFPACTYEGGTETEGAIEIFATECDPFEFLFELAGGASEGCYAEATIRITA
jgi:hypothetical protein